MILGPRFALPLAVALAFAAGNIPAAEPFRLPVEARVTETSADGKGWRASGEIGAPFVQTRAQLVSAVTAAGWRFLHEIPLGERNGRCLLAFSRGGYELTLMVWRIEVDKSGFSYGVSGKQGHRDK